VTDATETRATTAAAVAGAVLLLAGGMALIGAMRHVAAEGERALLAWQGRLGVVAESRAASVGDWLDRQRGVLRELTDNPSVQLYMTELALAGGDTSRTTAAAAQADYLRNLLNATAERAAFAAAPPVTPPVANVSRTSDTGLALVDATGRVVAATPGWPAADPKVQTAMETALAGREALIDLHAIEGGQRIGFALPIAGIQSDPSAKPIGAAIGLRLAGQALARRLVQPGDTDRDAATYIIRTDGGSISYLPALDRTLASNTPALVDAMLGSLGSGFAVGLDRNGAEVLAAARPVPGAPWTLVRTALKSSALAETEARLAWTLGVLVAAILAVAATIVAVWRHGTSLRAARAARLSREAAEREERLARFLRVVADAQPTEIAALDHNGTYRFANQAAAQAAGVAPEDLIGKTPVAALGEARAQPLEALNRSALELGARTGAVHRWPGKEGPRIVKSDHLPLKGDNPNRPGVLMVVEDITLLIAERERRDRALRDLVGTLVALVDRRDPFSSHHSARVAEVARGIAEEMRLEAVTVETVETAATLMNLGKMLVPAEILTKTAPLSAAELAQVRDAMLSGADLVKGVAFDGPVADTLRQLQERWDGTGAPEGLSGEAILPTARIVAVANTFVALASPRAHRAGLDLDGAAREILGRADSQFDRRPVTALINLLENRGARARWQWPARPSA
jgi:PAS domain S-box-containing protein